MRRVMLLLALTLAFPAALWAQGKADLSGTWKLSKAEPSGYTGARGSNTLGGGHQGAGWGATSPTIVIKQTGAEITVESTSFGDNERRAMVYTLDDKEKVTDDPKHPGIAGWKWMTKGRWEGATLVLFTYQGWNQVRDKLSLTGSQLTISREIDGQTGGTTSVTGAQTLVYTK